MKPNRYLIIGVILAATALFATLQYPNNLTANEDPGLPVTAIIATVSLTSTPVYENCGYMWAYHDSPGLTEKVSQGVRSINPNAIVRVQLFGEDCVYADGRATFSAMETDFYLELPVDSLSDEEAFGNWLAKTMLVITQIPEDEIQGNYGFVEFAFVKSETERITLRVPIQQYIQEANGRSGLELFRLFSTPPVNPT